MGGFKSRWGIPHNSTLPDNSTSHNPGVIKLLSLDESFDLDVESLAEKYDYVVVRGLYGDSGKIKNLENCFLERTKKTSSGEIYAVYRRINNKTEEKQK